MARIHHNTIKKALKAGVRLEVEDMTVVAYDAKTGKQLAEDNSATVALDKAIAKLAAHTPAKAPKASRKARDEDEFEEDESEAEADADDAEAEEDEEGSKSVVKAKYKKAYQPHHAKCGDDLSEQITAHVSRSVKVDGKSVTRVDAAALKRLAKANGVWVEGYASLNPGMQRMNVANRLRKLVKDGHEVVWA